MLSALSLQFVREVGKTLAWAERVVEIMLKSDKGANLLRHFQIGVDMWTRFSGMECALQSAHEIQGVLSQISSEAVGFQWHSAGDKDKNCQEMLLTFGKSKGSWAAMAPAHVFTDLESSVPARVFSDLVETVKGETPEGYVRNLNEVVKNVFNRKSRAPCLCHVESKEGPHSRRFNIS
eukprot:6492646-Amphidinium_carterae.3